MIKPIIFEPIIFDKGPSDKFIPFCTDESKEIALFSPLLSLLLIFFHSHLIHYV